MVKDVHSTPVVHQVVFSVRLTILHDESVVLFYTHKHYVVLVSSYFPLSCSMLSFITSLGILLTPYIFLSVLLLAFNYSQVLVCNPFLGGNWLDLISINVTLML